MTDGREIVWSTGLNSDPGSAPDLWRLAPGMSMPGIVFANSHRDSILSPIAVDNARYAVVESNRAVYGPNGYRLWFIPSAGARPVLVDQGDWKTGEPGPPIPRLALRGDRLVWPAVHHASSGLRFQLLEYSISDGTTRVLTESPASGLEFWNPSLAPDGNRLAYATVTPLASTFEFHIWYRDLASSLPATRMDSKGAATNPVLGDTRILWKTTSANVLNRGSLEMATLPSPVAPIVHPTQIASMGLITEPSVGNRYATAWSDQDHELTVLDLVTGNAQVVTTLAPGSPEALVRPVIAGDLIVFVHGYYDVKPLQIEWIDLSN